jgi:hypothetical protein
VTEPSLDKIIEHLQFCIADAKTLQTQDVGSPFVNSAAASP